MCYSALVQQSHKKLGRMLSATVDHEAYVALAEARLAGSKVRLSKAMDDAMLADGGRTAELVEEWRERQIVDLERLLAEQRERRAKAEAKLAVKETKSALNDVRVAGNKIRQFERRLTDLERTEPAPEDGRIWPGEYAAVVVQDGVRRVRPMRYQCRMPGWTPEIERKFASTYNARRDSLDTSWKRLFGTRHAVMVVDRFYESVQRKGKAVELEFTPQTGEPILVPCLWSYDERDDLYSFAAITDDPEPEVAAAGHDRTILNLQPEHVDAWLAGGSASDMHALFDQKRRPYYEHRESSA